MDRLNELTKLIIIIVRALYYTVIFAFRMVPSNFVRSFVYNGSDEYGRFLQILFTHRAPPVRNTLYACVFKNVYKMYGTHEGVVQKKHTFQKILFLYKYVLGTNKS